MTLIERLLAQANKEANELSDLLNEAAQALAQPQQEPVATCPQNIIYAIKAYGDARADQDANSAPMTSHERLADCIRLVREALAQPQQEPVAEVQVKMTGGNAGIATVIREIYDPFLERLQPGDKLYTSPPARKPLTDEEINYLGYGVSPLTRKSFARAIEAAHGITPSGKGITP